VFRSIDPFLRRARPSKEPRLFWALLGLLSLPPLLMAARRVQVPLTSFADTTQNIAAISFLLGAVFSAGLFRASSLPFSLEYHWPPKNEYPGGLSSAIQSPALGLYVMFWAIFHLLEYIVTATWNAPKAKVDCTCDNTSSRFSFEDAHTFSFDGCSVPDQ
jgi:hypothetical protein